MSFLYKQKAAYEMRISDWSSDVCSSDLIDARRVECGDHRFLGHVAKQRDLGALAVGQRMFAAADEQIGLDAERRQFTHRMLRGLGLQFARRRDVRHQRDVDADRLAAAKFVPELANRLDEGQRLDIAHRSEEHTSELQSLMRHSY